MNKAECKSTEILSVEISDYCDETVLVKARICGKDSVTFHVQTAGGEYRYSLGCWISTDDKSDIARDDFPGFDFERIIQEAEAILESKFVEYKGFTIQEIDGNFKVLERNSQYLNKDASPYCSKYDALDYFEDEDEAKEFIDSL